MKRMGAVVAAAIVGSLALDAGPAPAQMLGVPVLQNAFANRGITVGANFGTQDGARGYGAAASWAPGGGRLQISGGVGLIDAEVPDADRVRDFTWGGRAAFSILSFADRTLGVGAFVGIGGARVDRVTHVRVPIGASAGWRRAIGDTRALSVYVSPFYAYAEDRFDLAGLDCDVTDCPDETNRGGAFRVSAGVDVALAPSFGVTVGYETGQEASGGDPGPRSGILGVGLSYAFGRR